jgi:quinol-cytochrome oxidoreductase complex cytochrome b subunit
MYTKSVFSIFVSLKNFIMNKIIQQNGINFGLILGFLLILPTVLGYAINIALLVSYWTFGYVILTVIILGLLVIAFSKKALGGYISFKDAFSAYFLTILIAFLLSTIMNFLLFNVIDTNFENVVKEEQVQIIEGQREWVINKMSNASQEQIDETDIQFDEAIEKVRADSPYSITSLFKGFGISLAIFSLLGLLLALILKKKNPELD